MAKITVVNSGTIYKRTMGLIALGLAGFAIFMAPRCISSGSGYFQHRERVATIKESIEAKNYDEASSILETYATGGELDEGDVSVFRDRINKLKQHEKEQKELSEQERKQNEERERVKKENDKKAEEGAKRAKNLEAAIAGYKYDDAKNELASLVKESYFDGNKTQEYTEKIEAISAESILKSIEGKDGEEQIDLIEKFVSVYPAHEKSLQFKKKQVRNYLIVADSYFKTGTDETKVLEFLKKFGKYLKEQNPALVSAEDFSDFFKNATSYFDVRSREISREVNTGDKVIVTRALGYLHGKKNAYFHQGDLSDIPLGEKGVVIRRYGDDGSILANINDKQWRFIPNELRNSAPEELSAIYRQLNLMKEYIDGLKGTARETPSQENISNK